MQLDSEIDQNADLIVKENSTAACKKFGEQVNFRLNDTSD